MGVFVNKGILCGEMKLPYIKKKKLLHSFYLCGREREREMEPLEFVCNPNVSSLLGEVPPVSVDVVAVDRRRVAGALSEPG